jgi:hypothetical protein
MFLQVISFLSPEPVFLNVDGKRICNLWALTADTPQAKNM